MKPKFAIITSFLGQTKDRFHNYNDPATLDEKFAMFADIPDTDGVEVVYPYEVSDPADLNSLLKKHKLQIAAVNVNVKAEPEFVNGGLTSPDRGIRARAVQFIKDSKDFAEAVGAPHVTCCPLGDGFEFAFQQDYQEAWKRLVETFGEGASYKPTVPLFIEYKAKETRGSCFIDGAAKALCLLNDIGIDEMGVTIDYGHALLAHEQPAEALTLVENSRWDYYVHINDNDTTWDWDFFCGSHTLLKYSEFIYYLKRFGYSKYLTSDSHPTRWDMKGFFEINARFTSKVWNIIDNLGMDEFDRILRQENYLETWRFIEEKIFRFE